LDRGSQGEFAETPVCDFIRPHKLSKTEESIKAREELSEEEQIIMGAGIYKAMVNDKEIISCQRAFAA
jgi:hypothetical protein